jgi:hypothetical protein
MIGCRREELLELELSVVDSSFNGNGGELFLVALGDVSALIGIEEEVPRTQCCLFGGVCL